MTILNYVKFIHPKLTLTGLTMNDETCTLAIPIKRQEETGNFEISLMFPLIEISHFWHPTSNGVTNLPNLWAEPINLATNSSLPIFSFFNSSGNSRLTLALSETEQIIRAVIGVHEESASLSVTFIFPDGGVEDEVNLFLDGRDQPFHQGVSAAREWLYQQRHYQLLPYNESAFNPVYSTWYSYHQTVSQASLEAQAEKFAEYHLQTLILDDGWQTDDENRRYAYAGDWKVAEEKFPDMTGYIAKLQKTGMKCLFWVSLPYVGEKAAAFVKFRDKFLYFDEYQKAGILDPRFPEVRHYLVEKIIDLVKTLQLNGLKIDFVDSFKELSKQLTSEMHPTDLPQSINLLLKEMTAACLMYDPNFLFEFREDYIGPNMLQFCNMMRVKDCPNDFTKNRVGLTNIRLLCPSVAPHSDMIMFNVDDSLASLGLQFLNCLYGVLQLSVDLHVLSSEQADVVKFWMRYQAENQQTLMHKKFAAFNPHLNYDVIAAGDQNKQIISCYQSGCVVNLDKMWSSESVDLINATLTDNIVLASSKLSGQCVAFASYNMKGQRIASGKVELQDIQVLQVPACGVYKLRKI